MPQPFTSHRGKLALLDRANVDTDAIIPKQFLKMIGRTGFGPHCFSDWRYLPDGKPNPDFSLNQPRFSGATILITRNNFGCGSSREHAVWAIQQAGYYTVIAPKVERDGTAIPAFADIFRNNSLKNGLLTIELSDAEVNQIFDLVERFPGLEATVDLQHQRVTLHTAEEVSFHFEIAPAVKTRLLQGLDDISISLKHADAIGLFEAKHDAQIKR
jgi:3-isopropylmalate/(R)-2-methylmalate dehydratase small subunit